MTESKQIDTDLVKQEYFHLQKTVEDFDQRVVEIGKAQCATLRVVSSLSVHDLDDKLKHVGH